MKTAAHWEPCALTITPQPCSKYPTWQEELPSEEGATGPRQHLDLAPRAPRVTQEKAVTFSQRHRHEIRNQVLHQDRLPWDPTEPQEPVTRSSN